MKTPKQPLFKLVSVRKDNGEVTAMTKAPVTHAEGLVMISKITPHSFRELRLIEA